MHLGSAGTSQDVRHVITRCIIGALGRQGFKQLTAILSTVDGVQAFGDHSEFICAWNPYTNRGGVCPIQACHSGVFHVLDFVGSSRLGVVCFVSQHIWVWLVWLKSSRLGVVSSNVAFSLRNIAVDLMICQN